MQQPDPWQQQRWGDPAQVPVPYAPQVPGGEVPSEETDVRPFEALKFLFQDPDWQHNLLIGSVFYLVPMIGPFALMGWHCEIMQRLVRKHPKPIPRLDFSDLTHYLGRGVTPFVVSLVMTMPLSMGIAAVVFAVMMVGAAGAAALKEPAVMVLVGVLGVGISWLVGLVLGIVMNAAMTRAELTEDFGASFAFGKILDYAGKTWWKVLISNFLYGIVATPLIFVGYAACFVGLYPALIVLITGMTHLRFQQYVHYLSRGGEAVALKEPVAIPSEAAVATAAAYPPYGPPR